MPVDKKGAFSLIELILVVVVIIILASIAIPNYNKSKNKAIGREAVSSLKLMAAAERIYKIEYNNYTGCSCSAASGCLDADGCNNLLKLRLNTRYWLYSVLVASGVATAKATYQTDNSCIYTITSTDFDAEPVKGGGASCP